MTDWEWITEQIQRAMQTIDETQIAEENLRNHTTPETADEYTQQLRKLYEHLSSIKFIWEHEFNYSMDELADVMSEMFSGKPAPYRATRRFER
jgi:hypothetical protein